MAYNGGSDPTLAELITAKFDPEMFAREALLTAKGDLVCHDSFNTSYSSDLAMGYKVSIPVFTAASTTEVTPGTEPTAGDLASTPVSITIDKWYESSIEISDLAKIQNLSDYLMGGAKETGHAIMKAVDLDVSSLFSTINGSSVYGADGQTFTDAIFTQLTETLDEADVPVENRSLIGDPSMKADMFGIDKFVRMDYINGMPTGNGKFGMLYGAVVKISNNLTATTIGNYGVLAHRDAIGVVIQSKPRVRIWDMGYKFITKVITDCAWGADEIRDGFGKAFYTRKK